MFELYKVLQSRTIVSDGLFVQHGYKEFPHIDSINCNHVNPINPVLHVQMYF